MNRTTWIITIIFLAAAGVVVYVLYSTKKTLQSAQTAADKADNVIKDAQGLGIGFKKAWSDIGGLFAGENN